MYFSLKGVISTVCYCTYLIISWSTTTKSLWLPMYGRQPLVACSTVPTADENAVTESTVLPVITVFQLVPISKFLRRMSSCTAQDEPLVFVLLVLVH